MVLSAIVTKFFVDFIKMICEHCVQANAKPTEWLVRDGNAYFRINAAHRAVLVCVRLLADGRTDIEDVPTQNAMLSSQCTTHCTQ